MSIFWENKLTIEIIVKKILLRWTDRELSPKNENKCRDKEMSTNKVYCCISVVIGGRLWYNYSG